jgi:hypothetical protein
LGGDLIDASNQCQHNKQRAKIGSHKLFRV